MVGIVRRRARESSSNSNNTEEESEQLFIDGATKVRQPVLAPPLYSVYLICFGIILYIMASYFNDRLPEPNRDKSKGFIAERALNDLEGLVKIGPKVTGSNENEVIAVNYLMNILKDISKTAEPIHNYEIDLQKVSGAFSIWGLGLHYDNVQNIVVKIGPRNNASVLINCHFDTVPTSPGASDDGLNCAVMLEILRIISISKEPLTYGAIFLFNGAEENPLMASHGFITQHKWAKEVKAFINLESCGAGGQEMLFQTGPNCAWVTEAYGLSAIHPAGNVIGEELFQSGVIPSDTDFRIFRDYGHIPGLDFAHCGDGYVYHTKRDNMKSIVNIHGVIQHTGDNILSLVMTFTGKDSKLNSLNSIPKANSVYFDFLGLFFITYSETTALVINLLTILISSTCLGLLVRQTKRLWILADLSLRSSALLVGLALSMIYNLLLAIIMDSFSSSMTWFTQAYYLAPLYIMPTVVLVSLPVSLIHSFLKQKKYQPESTNPMVHFIPTQLLWTMFLLICTLMNMRSAFMFVILILPPAVIFVTFTLLQRQEYRMVATVSYFVSTWISSLLLVFFGIKALKLFLPITGRAGPTLIPDLPIAGLVTLLTFVVFSYICCLSSYIKKIEVWAKYVMLIHASIVLVLIFGKIAFPFSEATPQRVLITDVTRNSSSPVESFLWFDPWERRAVSVLPKVATLPTVKKFCTDEEPHCGLPWTSAKLFMKSVEVSRWLPSTAHNLVDMTQLDILTDEVSSDHFRTITLRMTGPSHMTLLMHSHMTLKTWSLDKSTPLPIYTAPTGKTYAIRHVHGLKTPSWNVTLKFQMKNGESETIDRKLHIDFIGHHIHGDTQTSPSLDRFIRTLPEWVHVTPSLATVKSFNLY
ncbi:hypothetical protein O3M35_000733 [Rhynocoris fuscipes]|uniref:FXNA-like protease n=1 Tax=Rhynocoris fuscipes TaxID=488301 RepID=A0AAW1DQJ3_9HEMI